MWKPTLYIPCFGILPWTFLVHFLSVVVVTLFNEIMKSPRLAHPKNPHLEELDTFLAFTAKDLSLATLD